MGSPDSEPERIEDEGPALQVTIAPFWMGKYEVTWDEFERVRLQPRHQEEEARRSRPRHAARDREGRRRRHPPHPALRRHDLRLRPQEQAGDLHDPPRGDGILPLALGQDRQELPPADRGRVGIRLPRRDHHRLLASATTRRSSASTPGTSRTPRSRCRSARRSPTPGASTTCTATSPSGASTTTPDAYDAFAKRRANGPVVLPDAKEYPYVARGGSWDDDADRLRSAARRGSEPGMERPGPPAPPEHLVAHRRHASSASASSAPSRSRKTSRASSPPW